MPQSKSWPTNCEAGMMKAPACITVVQSAAIGAVTGIAAGNTAHQTGHNHCAEQQLNYS